MYGATVPGNFPRRKAAKPRNTWCSLSFTCPDWNISASYCRLRKTHSRLYTWSGREYLITCCWYQQETTDRSISVGHMTAWRVLHAQLLYPYHLRHVHVLTPVDYPPRENSSWCLVHQTVKPFLFHQCSSQTRWLLVEMASEISTPTINGYRKIHMVHFMLDTISSLGLTRGLLCHMFCHKVIR